MKYMRYQYNQDIVHVVQWTGDNWGQVSEFGCAPKYVRGAGQRARKNPEAMPVIVYTPDGSRSAKKGDYIVRFDSMFYFPFPENSFERIFEYIDYDSETVVEPKVGGTDS